MNRKATRVETFKVCAVHSVLTRVKLRTFTAQVLISQLHFRTNKNSELAVILNTK